jgi:phosphoribosylglycinamide formyltransferase 1
MKKIAILFSGTGTNLLNIIEKLHNKECEVVVAITNKSDALGIEKAKYHDISVEVVEHKHYDTREAFDTKLVEILNNNEIDLAVMAGFMRILTPIFTNSVKAINIHPSYLPHHKGHKAIEKSFESDDDFGGASVHWVNEELDGGAVILQNKFLKYHDETLESFEEKIHEIEYEIYPQAIVQVLADR